MIDQDSRGGLVVGWSTPDRGSPIGDIIGKIFIATQSKSYNQGRTSERTLYLLTCIHPVTSCRAGWIFHTSMSLGSFGSSMQATPSIQARIIRAHQLYLGKMTLGTVRKVSL